MWKSLTDFTEAERWAAKVFQSIPDIHAHLAIPVEGENWMVVFRPAMAADGRPTLSGWLGFQWLVDLSINGFGIGNLALKGRMHSRPHSVTELNSGIELIFDGNGMSCDEFAVYLTGQWADQEFGELVAVFPDPVNTDGDPALVEDGLPEVDEYRVDWDTVEPLEEDQEDAEPVSCSDFPTAIGHVVGMLDEQNIAEFRVTAVKSGRVVWRLWPERQTPIVPSDSAVRRPDAVERTTLPARIVELGLALDDGFPSLWNTSTHPVLCVLGPQSSGQTVLLRNIASQLSWDPEWTVAVFAGLAIDYTYSNHTENGGPPEYPVMGPIGVSNEPAEIGETIRALIQDHTTCSADTDPSPIAIIIDDAHAVITNVVYSAKEYDPWSPSAHSHANRVAVKELLMGIIDAIHSGCPHLRLAIVAGHPSIDPFDLLWPVVDAADATLVFRGRYQPGVPGQPRAVYTQRPE